MPSQDTGHPATHAGIPSSDGVGDRDREHWLHYFALRRDEAQPCRSAREQDPGSGRPVPQVVEGIRLGPFGRTGASESNSKPISVISYSVNQRVQEIGIRLALGARLSDVLRMIVFEGMRPTLLGVAIGVVGALALGRVMSSLIYGVKPTDPLTLIFVAALLTSITIAASYIPARRATKVDPLVALRYE